MANNDNLNHKKSKSDKEIDKNLEVYTLSNKTANNDKNLQNSAKRKPKSVSSIALCLTIILVLVTVDQLTKIVFYKQYFSIIDNFLEIHYLTNTGAAFSIMEGAQWFFIILTIVVLYGLFFVIFTRRISNSTFFRVTLSILIGGIIGNFIDRFAFSCVRDFLHVVPFGFVCNMADIFITVATIMLCVYILFLHDKDKKKTKKVRISDVTREPWDIEEMQKDEQNNGETPADHKHPEIRKEN